VFYVIQKVAESGIADIGIVVSPRWEEEFRRAVGDGSKWEAKIDYIIQPESLGLAHAVKVSHSFIGSSPFLLFLGDNLVEVEVASLISEFKGYHCDALILLKEVPDARAFGVAELDSQGRIIRVEEKPRKPRSNLALVGVYLFSEAVWEIIEGLRPSPRGELEITDAIQGLISRGREVRSYILPGRWLDVGQRDDLLLANSLLLQDRIQPGIQGEVDNKSHVLGKVEVGRGTAVRESDITGPVFLGESNEVIGSSVGPEVSLGTKVRIEDSFVERSIIMEGCHISHIHLRDSILGRRVKVAGKGKSSCMQLTLSDDCQVEL
jgi:glucose-1-phosphate thymidylyltransferase